MKQRDIIFKIGLGLQLLLIPVALLWHFSQEANYYNWVVGISFALVAALFFWPQTLLGRLKRLAAIRLQLILTIVLLILSWLAYAYFYHFTKVNNSNDGTGYGPMVIYSINWESLFGRRWVMLLGPGIGPLTAAVMSAVFLALPFTNLYRYQLDRKRINGLKKDDLFV
jgi:uncharacterized protein with PQ loop repeat